MIALGDGVCSDTEVHVSQQYLARIDERYFVITPIDPKGCGRLSLPYMEAEYIDPLDRQRRKFGHLHELAPIY